MNFLDYRAAVLVRLALVVGQVGVGDPIPRQCGRVWLGTFDTVEAAAAAYDNDALRFKIAKAQLTVEAIATAYNDAALWFKAAKAQLNFPRVCRVEPGSLPRCHRRAPTTLTIASSGAQASCDDKMMRCNGDDEMLRSAAAMTSCGHQGKIGRAHV